MYLSLFNIQPIIKQIYLFIYIFFKDYNTDLYTALRFALALGDWCLQQKENKINKLEDFII